MPQQQQEEEEEEVKTDSTLRGAEAKGAGDDTDDVSSRVFSDSDDRGSPKTKTHPQQPQQQQQPQGTTKKLLPDRPSFVGEQSRRQPAQDAPRRRRRPDAMAAAVVGGFASDSSIFSDDEFTQRKRSRVRRGRQHLLCLESSFETLYDPQLDREDGLIVGLDASKEVKYSSSDVSEEQRRGPKELRQLEAGDRDEASDSSTPLQSDDAVVKEMLPKLWPPREERMEEAPPLFAARQELNSVCDSSASC